jgi:hypothetical protein
MNSTISLVLLIGLSLIFLNLIDVNLVSGQTNNKNDTTQNKGLLLNLSNSSVFKDSTITIPDKMSNQDKQDIKVVELLGNNFSFPISYEVIDGIPLAEGDIIIDTTMRDPSKAAGDRFVYNDIWPGGKIPYKIDSSLEADKINMIKKAIKYWNLNTPIEFIEITPSNEFRYNDYVFIKKYDGNDPRLLGAACASAVGKIARGGEQTIDIFPNCQYGNMIHELGHTAGFWHEQSRPDRDRYVEILWDNIRPGEGYKLQFATERCFERGSEQVCDFPDTIGDYDYCSIQHYNKHAFAKPQPPGLVTIKTLGGVIGCDDIGQREFLSPGDIEAVNELYSSQLLPTSVEIPGVQFLQYKDEYFKIEYPKDSSIDGPFTVGGKYSVFFTLPVIEFIDPVGVDVIELPSQTTLEDYVSEKKLLQERIIDQDLINTTEKRMTINNISAIELRHNHIFQETPSVWATTYLLDDSTIYTIAYDIFEHDLDEKSNAVLNHMVNSFEINK